MANTRELRRRIKSIKNTSQITKAMQMVAATKMRRAQNQALSGRPYSETLNQALERLGTSVNSEVHPLLSKGMGNTVGVLLLSTDKALCGALNTNLFRAIINSSFSSVMPAGRQVKYFTVGAKGRNFLVKTGKSLEADFENPEVVIFRQARQVSKLLISAFLEGSLSEVYLAYPQFVSTLRQEPKIVKILPITREGQEASNEFLFEPSTDALLDFALNHHIETQIYQALLETKASEHSARMMAMQNATDNAKELVEDLQLTYNQTRQAAITNELLEITTAQVALE